MIVCPGCEFPKRVGISSVSVQVATSLEGFEEEGILDASMVHFARPSRSTVNGQRPPATAAAAARPRKRIVWLLEGGCTSDTKHLKKIRGKTEQHKTLLKLEASRLRGCEARLGILTFGVGGTMYSATQDALHDTGIEPVEMTELLKDIHLHSKQICGKSAQCCRPETPPRHTSTMALNTSTALSSHSNSNPALSLWRGLAGLAGLVGQLRDQLLIWALHVHAAYMWTANCPLICARH